MKDGGHGVITIPHFVIFSIGRVWVWRTGCFTPRTKVPVICWTVGRGGGGGSHRARLETLVRGKALFLAEILRTTARFSSHYCSYCINWAIRINTYEFISWLSRMFISCRFGVKPTAKHLFFRFNLQSTKKLRHFQRFRRSCRDVILARSLQAGKEVPFLSLHDGWYRNWWRQTDSPNCETETAKRTLQNGSLTVPADGDKINFQKVAVVL